MSGTHIVNVGAPCLLERFTKIVLRKLTIIVGIIMALSVNSRFARGRSTSSLWFQFVSKGKQFLSRFTRFWKVVVQYVIQVCYFGVATNMLILSMTVFGFYFFVKLKCYISICFRWILFREPVRYVYLTITLCLSVQPKACKTSEFAESPHRPTTRGLFSVTPLAALNQASRA